MIKKGYFISKWIDNFDLLYLSLIKLLKIGGAIKFSYICNKGVEIFSLISLMPLYFLFIIPTSMDG